MKKLLKGVIFASLIVVAFFAIGPFVMGFLVKNKYESLANLDTDNFSSQVQSYERGWFDSVATGTISIYGLPQDVLLSYNDKIKHGPFLFTKDSLGKTKFILGRGLIQDKVKLGDTTFNIQALLGLGGDLSFNGNEGLVSFALNDVNGQGVKVSLHDVNIDGNISSNIQNIESSFSFESGLIEDEQGDDWLLLSQFTTDTKLKKEQELWVGQRNFLISEIELKENETFPFSFELKNVKAVSNYKIHNKKLTSNVALSIDNLVFNNES